MKRWIAVILMMLVLMQALPLNALATIGNVLTEDELTAAYALTGFGEGGTQSNSTYHRGMQPNVRWNAMQFSDWLEDKLNVDIKNVTDILSRASNTLTELKGKDPEAYERFAKASYDGVTVIERLQGLTLEAEILREELSYQQDRLREDAAHIQRPADKLEHEEMDRQIREDEKRLAFCQGAGKRRGPEAGSCFHQALAFFCRVYRRFSASMGVRVLRSVSCRMRRTSSLPTSARLICPSSGRAAGAMTCTPSLSSSFR